MIVYHGSTEKVEKPDVMHTLRNLDFGKGFYVTTSQLQAESLARRKIEIQGRNKGVVCVYQYKEDDSLRILDFDGKIDEWLDFVCDCRSGGQKYKEYDVIKGKVADDRVYRVVNFYMTGVWDKDRTLREMRVYEMYDQIAFITQKAIDSMLSYELSYEVTANE